jgi:hypothetical protein
MIGYASLDEHVALREAGVWAYLRTIKKGHPCWHMDVEGANYITQMMDGTIPLGRRLIELDRELYVSFK